MSTWGNLIKSLIDECDSEDRMLAKEAQEESRLANKIYLLEDGKELSTNPVAVKPNAPPL